MSRTRSRAFPTSCTIKPALMKGLVVGTCCRDLLQGLAAGTCRRDVLQGLVAGTCCRDLLQGLVAGTCCRDLPLREIQHTPRDRFYGFIASPL